jgi:FkbM family methyltransferase
VSEYKNKTAIFCKSFRDDFAILQKLLDSVSALGMEHYPFLLSIPERDLVVFDSTIKPTPGLVVITDESYLLGEELFMHGWFQQQVCKLAVHRTKFASSYFMIDSDSYFLKPIDDRVFFTEGKPNIVCSPLHTVYTENNGDLIALLSSLTFDKHHDIWPASTQGFQERLTTLQGQGLAESANQRAAYIPMLFQKRPGEAYQPSQIFHSYILEMFEHFLQSQDLNFERIIKLSPWEYNWYACFASALGKENVYGIVSPVMHFATYPDVLSCRRMGFSVQDIGRHFYAIQMGARHFECTDYDEQAIPGLSIQEKKDLNMKHHIAAGRQVREQFESMIGLLRPHAIFDIGALYGGVAKQFKLKSPNSRVIAFEASPAHYAECFKSGGPTRNGIEFECIAIGDSDRVSDYYVLEHQNNASSYDWRVGASSLYERWGEKSERIPVVMRKLDSWSRERNLIGCSNALWIDGPGAATEILAGAEETLRSTLFLRVAVDKAPFYKGQKLDVDVIRLLKHDFKILKSSVVEEINQYELLLIRRDIFSIIEASNVT